MSQIKSMQILLEQRSSARVAALRLFRMSMAEALQKHSFENAEIVKLVLDHSEQTAEKNLWIPALGVLSLIKAMKQMLVQHDSVDEEVVRLLGMSFVEMLQQPTDTVDVIDYINEADEAVVPGSSVPSPSTLQALSADDAADIDITPCPQQRLSPRELKRKRTDDGDGLTPNKRRRHTVSRSDPASGSTSESSAHQEQVASLQHDTLVPDSQPSSYGQVQRESQTALASVPMPQETGLQTPNLSDDEVENVEEGSVVAETIYGLSEAASESDDDGCFVSNCSEVTIPDVRCFGRCQRRAHNKCLANQILGKHDWGTCEAC